MITRIMTLHVTFRKKNDMACHIKDIVMAFLDFLTDLCPGTVGPSYGEVLMFNSASLQDAWVMPTTNLDCWVTLRYVNPYA